MKILQLKNIVLIISKEVEKNISISEKMLFFINLDKHTTTNYERNKYENEQAVIKHFEIPKNWDGLLYFL
uniref:hypothetical protein n=1 Tax=Onion yellows phytoplasma TaxID=100379 RepID=UPI0018662C8D|nr:hypothetical protein [Onion yellows phytoplasma]